MLRLALVATLLLAISAFAQPAPPPDPVFLQKAVAVVADQRNQALNALASAQAQLEQAREENAALKKQIEDLKPKSADPATPK